MSPEEKTTPAAAAAALPHGDQHIALIGLGAIGISFLALHLTYTSATISVYDPRPDLQDHVASMLPLYMPRGGGGGGGTTRSDTDTDTDIISSLVTSRRLRFCTSLGDAVSRATIIQEQGPETLSFKQSTWSEVLRHTASITPAPHLWSSTSGIPASKQLEHLQQQQQQEGAVSISDAVSRSARSRLLVVHPFNPPHLMPLLELVPSPHTSAEAVTFAESYFRAVSSVHQPITIKRETAGFVANRLSFILFREACSLVARGVCTVEELDEVVRASLGPRWAVGGPFRMYNFGGGPRGMAGFLDNIGGAIRGVWEDVDRQGRQGGSVMMEGMGVHERGHEGGRESVHGGGRDDEEEAAVRDWKRIVTEQTIQAYGVPSPQDVRARDHALVEVVGLQVRLEAESKEKEKETRSVR
ncbi:3-hydroxyacyl-CoA dehyrogenase [Cladophialophora carrionii]|uniref:3-hydroxyacyl-CoA dehyrogenase n=1 Tax=Cladophialophora carrionii TaxID=86049 RepID=A0A1C1C7Z0_9EURO|nr:3-hydroxyacyl-CoA dehyrogenase [Cladophialophora carrionii]